MRTYHLRGRHPSANHNNRKKNWITGFISSNNKAKNEHSFSSPNQLGPQSTNPKSQKIQENKEEWRTWSKNNTYWLEIKKQKRSPQLWDSHGCQRSGELSRTWSSPSPPPLAQTLLQQPFRTKNEDGESYETSLFIEAWEWYYSRWIDRRDIRICGWDSHIVFPFPKIRKRK